MDVNTQAPVVGHSEVDIAGDQQLVWEVLTGISNWPTWNPDVKSVEVDGDVAEGTQFRWKVGPGRIASKILRVESPSLLAWDGKATGMTTRHVWRVEPHDGGTRVIANESWEGFVPRLMRKRLQPTMDKALASNTQHLKAEVERRSGS